MRMNNGSIMDRPRAVSLASARRQLRIGVAEQSTSELRQELRVIAYLLTVSDGIRPPHIKRCDQHRARMIRNELARRSQGRKLTAADWNTRRFTWNSR